MIKFYELMSLGEVSRWNIVNRVKPQSVAEHSFLVAVVAMELGQKLGVGRLYSLFLLHQAMFHDATEAVTGDIPTPAKRLIGGRVKEIEHELMPELPFFANLGPSGTREKLALIVKVADLIEAYHWISENGMGNRAKIVTMDVRGRLMERVRRASSITKEDWFGPVNGILTTLGLPFIHSEERVSP